MYFLKASPCIDLTRNVQTPIKITDYVEILLNKTIFRFSASSVIKDVKKFYFSASWLDRLSGEQVSFIIF